MKNKSIILFAATLAITLSSITTWYRHKAIWYQHLQFEVTSTNNINKPIIQCFYNLGKGYRENDSQSYWLKKKKDQKIYCRIPSKKLYGLRIDILNGPGKVTISNLEIITNKREAIFHLTESLQINRNQVESINISNNQLHVLTTHTANDPYIEIPFSPPLISPSILPKNELLIQQFFFGAKLFFIIFITLATILLLTRPRETGNFKKQT